MYLLVMVPVVSILNDEKAEAIVMGYGPAIMLVWFARRSGVLMPRGNYTDTHTRTSSRIECFCFLQLTIKAKNTE